MKQIQYRFVGSPCSRKFFLKVSTFVQLRDFVSSLFTFHPGNSWLFYFKTLRINKYVHTTKRDKSRRPFNSWSYNPFSEENTTSLFFYCSPKVSFLSFSFKLLLLFSMIWFCRYRDYHLSLPFLALQFSLSPSSSILLQ